MFEMPVEDVFTITGVGTVFVGRVVAGSIAVGDPIICRTRSGEEQVRVIGLQDASGRRVQSGEFGSTIGVVCRQIDLGTLADSMEGEGDDRRVVGVSLVTAPKKKSWWSF